MATQDRLRRGFVKEGEEYSLEFRKELNIQPHEALPARDLAELLGISVLAFSEADLDDSSRRLIMASKISGFTIKNYEGNSLIIVNDSHSFPRLESTIMHEIAHNLLNHHILAESDLPINFLGRHFNRQMEKEAQMLGSILQIPQSGLLTLLGMGYDRERIADTFCASKEMVIFRYRKCGLLRRLGKEI